jgi:hypothetical protein
MMPASPAPRRPSGDISSSAHARGAQHVQHHRPVVQSLRKAHRSRKPSRLWPARQWPAWTDDLFINTLHAAQAWPDWTDEVIPYTIGADDE